MTAILILTALAAFVVLVVVAVVVMGHGGQLARFEADHPPLDLPVDRPVVGRDVARIRLPLALWGYHVRAVDELLDRVAADINERDAHIARLEARLGEQHAAPGLDQREWGPRALEGASAVRIEAGSSQSAERPQGPQETIQRPPVRAWAASQGDHDSGQARQEDRA